LRADVAEGLATIKRGFVVEFFRREKLGIRREDARYMTVPDEAQPLELGEDCLHLWSAVDVFREEMFLEWIAGRGVNEQHTVLLVRKRSGFKKCQPS
jgi:hypothetical protein